MERKDEILNLKAAFDIRVETLVANLLNDDDQVYGEIEPEDIYLSPVGPIRRRIDYDVNEIKWKYYDDDPVLFLQVNRQGLFDNLPERLLLDLDKQYETPVMRTKAIQQQIAEARKFFLPYEMSIYTSRIRVEQMEQRLVEEFPEFMNELWGLNSFEDCLSPRQMFLLNYLIPEAYRTVGNWELTELIFENVLQFDVSFSFEKPMAYPTPAAVSTSSEWTLGEPFVIGGEFKDDVATLSIRIVGVTQGDLPSFMEGGANYRVLNDVLCSYFLPLDMPVNFEIQVTQNAFETPLGECYLGYNLRL